MLKLLIIQTDIIWENKKKNLLKYEKLLSSIKENVDIIILPEMFSTGFSMNPNLFAETLHGETIEWMIKSSMDNKAAICGSLIVEDNGKYVNRFVFIHENSNIEFYDKRHLYRMAGEADNYSKGLKRTIINFKGWKIYPQICYDLRFPVWARNIEGYDLYLNVANWPAQRKDVWLTLLKARAYENLCYSIGVNRIGVDGNDFEYSGDSIAYSAKGEVLAKIGSDVEGTAIVELSKENLIDLRNKFPAHLDADEFEVK